MSKGPARTFDLPRLRQLAGEKKSAREIAEAMGVSRQRIYQVAKREGVQIHQPIGRPHTRRRRDQISRVRTGGVEHLANSSTAGRICEMLVAADLMARGWKVFFPINDRGQHDLVGSRKGEIYSFEVRSASRRDGSDKLIFRRDRPLASDFYAIVVRSEPVAYEPSLPD